MRYKNCKGRKIELKYHFVGRNLVNKSRGENIFRIDHFFFFKRFSDLTHVLFSFNLRNYVVRIPLHSNSFRSHDFLDESREEGILFKIATKNFNKSPRKGDGPPSNTSITSSF